MHDVFGISAFVIVAQEALTSMGLTLEYLRYGDCVFHIR